jgi:hypothetical protein
MYELGMLWKEPIEALYDILFRHLLGGIEEKYKNLIHDN